MNHQGGEPDPARENVNDCAGDEVVSRDRVDLQVLLDARHRLSPEHVALIGHDIATALEHAHNPGFVLDDGSSDLGAIVHRDVSPSNVLVSRHGEVKLSDFGLANVAEAGSRQSEIRGKFPYMAPERLRADPLDGRSDLFSLGVVLFEALAGRRPYEGGHDPATIMLIMAGEHPSLGDLAPGTPPELCRIVESLIESDREKRPQSASALAEQLEPFVPPPDARRKLGKMVTEARSLRAAHKPIGSGPLAESKLPRRSPDLGAAEPSPSRGWSRRTLIRVAVGSALALGLAATGLMLWRPAEEGGKPVTPAAIPQAAATETHSSRDTNPQSETVEASDEKQARDTSGADETAKQVPRVIPAARPAELTVLVYPWGRVWINGKPRGSAPLKNEALKPGRYQIRAGQDGRLQTQTVALQPGERKTIRFDLTEQ